MPTPQAMIHQPNLSGPLGIEIGSSERLGQRWPAGKRGQTGGWRTGEAL